MVGLDDLSGLFQPQWCYVSALFSLPFPETGLERCSQYEEQQSSSQTSDAAGMGNVCLPVPYHWLSFLFFL